MSAAADLLDAERRPRSPVIDDHRDGQDPRARPGPRWPSAPRACRFYAEHAEAFLADEPLDDPPRSAPAGRTPATSRSAPVLAVMPWNFPLWQVIRFAAPALMAGNVGLLKHASNVPQTALVPRRRCSAGPASPTGAFQTLLIGSGQVEAGARATRGSRRPRSPAARPPAGRWRRSPGDELKKTVLELGGSDPFVVMPSADLERGRRGGDHRPLPEQRPVLHRRQAVHRAHRRLRRVRRARSSARMAALRVGDPMDAATDVGPLATEQGRDDIEEQVADAVAQGCRGCCCGGQRARPARAGSTRRRWSPTSPPRCGSTPRRSSARSPTLYRVADVDEAIELANDTPFGLGSNAWTNDPAEQERFAADLDAGGVFVNGMTIVVPASCRSAASSAPATAASSPAHGIREFCNIKTVWVA